MCRRGRWLLQGTGASADARALLSGVVGANAINNLPALLVGLPRLEHGTTWAFLAGVNFGPVWWIRWSVASRPDVGAALAQ